jgi:uncharacterized sulfatase
MDDSTGRILRILAERDLAENTLVIFTSDNGTPFPFGKGTLYEPGINVPFIVRWPGVIEPGATSEAMVSLVDLLPTVLDTMSIPEPGGLDGRSLLPLLRREAGSPRERVVGVFDELLTEAREGRPETAETPSEDSPLSRSIRDSRFKYIRNLHTAIEFKNNVLANCQTWRNWGYELDENPGLEQRMHQLRFRPAHELFDLEEDPWELENLAFERDHLETRERLRGELEDWMEREGDPLAEEMT